MSISALFLMGMFLNWFLYTRHERIDRVYIEPIEIEEEDEEEDIKMTSLEEKAIKEYQFEKHETFEVEGVNYYVR